MAEEGVKQEISKNFYEDKKWRFVSYAIWIGLALFLMMITMVGGAGKLSAITAPKMLENIFQSWLILAILIPPMIMVSSTGGLDLSVGAVAGLVAVTAATAMVEGASGWIAVFIALKISIFIGLVNGLLIGLTRINGFVITLGMATLARGAALQLSQGGPAALAGPDALFPGLSIVMVFFLILLTIILIVLAELTPLGRKRFTNVENESLVLHLIRTAIPYLLSSVMAGFAGLLLLARLRTAFAGTGIGLETEVILSLFLAGIPLGGGLFNVIGALIASFVVSLQKAVTIVNGTPVGVIQTQQGYGLLIFGVLSQVYFLAVNWFYKKQMADKK
ncbi:MAG: ABC transporter permease [Chloroflexi bacterium]|nr:ABC transporter permease [Chloroflexota bacterium]